MSGTATHGNSRKQWALIIRTQREASRSALLYDRTHYSKAELLYQKALEARRKTLGSNHRNRDSLASLARHNHLLGTEAGLLCDPEYRESVLGPNHPDTLKNLDNLAWLWFEIGRAILRWTMRE